MHLIYCLVNDSFKENIVNVGITISDITLNQLLESINKSFLPIPYTVFLTKNVYNNNCIKILYSLMCKFGKHIDGTFFEIQPEIVKQLFDLIQNETLYKNDETIINNSKNNVDYDIYEQNDNINLQDKYIIIQNEIEYIIPKAQCYDDNIYSVPYIADVFNDLDNIYYDKLSIYRNTYDSNSIIDNNNYNDNNDNNNNNNIDDLEL
jgi:hypothetical protein